MSMGMSSRRSRLGRPWGALWCSEVVNALSGGKGVKKGKFGEDSAEFASLAKAQSIGFVGMVAGGVPY